MGLLDRFNVGRVATEHWRSMTRYNTGGPDYVARTLLYGLPVAAAVATVLAGYSIANPTVFLPSLALLAGVMLAAVGQTIAIRARIADSVTLSGNLRLKAHFRESISGMLMAAVAALLDALLLGITALTWSDSSWRIATSSVSAAITVYLVLMFLITARRLYTAYLEAFEDGIWLPKPAPAPKPPVVSPSRERAHS